MARDKLCYQMATSMRVNIGMEEDMDSENTNLLVKRQGKPEAIFVLSPQFSRDQHATPATSYSRFIDEDQQFKIKYKTN